MYESLSTQSVAATADPISAPEVTDKVPSPAARHPEGKHHDIDHSDVPLEPTLATRRRAPRFEARTARMGRGEAPTDTLRSDRPSMADVLHVGCGMQNVERLPPVFRAKEWREIRLDIDPKVSPDHVASITDMRVIFDGAVDAVYSSHNLEHLYPHEVSVALREMHRVLKPAGFAFIKLPDLQEVARHVAEGKLEDPLYMSPMGPIAPLDIFYGHRPSLAHGNMFMAHRTGFTADTLGGALIRAGFFAVMVQRNPPAFCLDAIAFRTQPDDEQIARVQARMLPAPDRPAVLYTSVA